MSDAGAQNNKTKKQKPALKLPEELDAAPSKKTDLRALSAVTGARYGLELLSVMNPPFAGQWSALAVDDAAPLLARVALMLARKGVDKPWPLTHEALALRVSPLPCYGRALYVDAVMRDRTGTPAHAAFVLRGDEIYLLSQNSDEVHALNHKGFLELDSDLKIRAYLRFFCWVVCGNHGPFQLIDSADIIPYGAVIGREFISDVAPTDDDVMDFMIHDDDIKIADAITHFYSANVFYDQEVFTANFGIYDNGLVEMLFDNKTDFDQTQSHEWRLTHYIRYREETL